MAFGPFIKRNHFTGWMLLALPVAVGYFASLVAKGMVGVKPGWRNRISWFSTPDASRAVLTGVAILVMGFALALTLSRSGISCFLLAMVLPAFHVLPRQQSTAKERPRGCVGRRLAHFVKFPGLPHEFGLAGRSEQILSIKVEVDTNPPAGAAIATTLVRRHLAMLEGPA